MTCNHCNISIPPNSDFCPFCGNKVILSVDVHTKNKNTAMPVTSPLTSNASTKEANPQQKQRYCSLCGGAINLETKKCEKCKKQYFKFPVTKNNLIAVILALSLCISIGFNIFQYNDMTGLINSYHALKEKSDKTERNLSATESERIKLAAKCSRITDALSMYKNNLFFYIPGSRTYHTFSCEGIRSAYYADKLNIITWSDAQNYGYSKCSRCV